MITRADMALRELPALQNERTSLMERIARAKAVRNATSPLEDRLRAVTNEILRREMML